MIEHLRNDQPVTLPEEVTFTTDVADTITYTPVRNSSSGVIAVNSPEPSDWTNLIPSVNGVETPIKSIHDKLIGGSLVWNQLINDSIDYSTTGGTVRTSDGVGIFKASASGQQIFKSYAMVTTHVYYTGATYCTTTATSDVKFRSFARDINGLSSTGTQSVYAIGKASGPDGASVGVIDRRSSDWDNITVYHLICVDLTNMLGPAVANYIYSLATSNAESAIAFVHKYLGTRHIPYSVNRLESVSKLSAHKIVGFNLLDENNDGYTIGPSYRFIDVPVGAMSQLYMTLRDKGNNSDVSGCYIGFASSSYNGTGTVGPYRWVLSNGTVQNTHTNISSEGLYLDRIVIYPQSIDGWNRIRERYEICVNVHGDGLRDGEYEPYIEHTYPLDPSIVLRGVPELRNGEVSFIGDALESNGTITRKVKQITIDGVTNTITGRWRHTATSYGFAFYKTVSDWKRAANPTTNYANVISDLFTSSGYAYADMALMTVGGSSGVETSMTFVLPSDITTVSAANAWFAAHPTTIIYELATPATEQASPFADPQIVESYGAHTYISTSEIPVPVGHETTYDMPEVNSVSGTNTFKLKNVNTTALSYKTISTPADNQFSTTVKTPTADQPYLWNYEKITYTNGNSVNQDKRIISVYGKNGNTGKSITKVTEYYALSVEPVEPPITEFSMEVKTVTPVNRFLWNYEVYTYSDNTAESSDKRIIGVYGNTGNGYVYIEGTQTAATASWNGTTTELSEIVTGTQILFHLNYASKADATLNLTLSDGSTTGAVAIYYSGTTRMGTQYPANSMVPLVFDGTSWYVAAPYTNSNTYDRTRYSNEVKVSAATTSYGIYVGDSTGYREAAAGVTFDINYPPLYYASTDAVAAGSTTTNMYLSYPSISLRNTVSGISLTANQMAYIRGTLSGNTFTIAAANVPTSGLPAVFSNAPTTADGYLYIPVGILYSAYQIFFVSSRELYKYDVVRGFGLLQNATVVSVTKQYYLHTTSETAPGAGVTWVDTIPAIDATKYLWTRDKIIYTTGDPGYTAPECITQYTNDIVRPNIQNAISSAQEYAAGLVTEEREARLAASSSYALKTELSEYRSWAETQLAVRDDQISAKATKTEVSQIVTDLGEVQQFRREVGNYMTFDATNGLTLSALNSAVKTVLDNSSWKLKIQDTVVQQVDAQNGAQFSSITIKALTSGATPSLVLGNLTIIVESDGTVTGRKT